MSSFVKVLAASDLEEGVPRVVWVRQREVMVVRMGSEVYAMDNECPHRAAPLSSGAIEDGEVVCPMHGWRVRLGDGACRERPDRPHRTYPARLEGGEILLAV